MTNIIKKILYRIFGFSNYLKILYVSFFVLYDLNILKHNYLYKYHYFVKNLINKGDYVVDIGANLGYFSRIFSRLVSSDGRVISIEPVKPFFDILVWGLKKKKNCIFYNKALGLENRKIELALPKINGFFRTGLAHVVVDHSERKDSFIFETEMVKGSELLNELPKLNYIKCDIEGYEEYVLQDLEKIIEKYKPVVQIETSGAPKIKVFELMEGLGYVRFTVYKNKIAKDIPDDIEPGDYLFIHGSSEEEIFQRLTDKNLAWPIEKNKV
jgi:FkbM family methyltransferase